MKGFNGWGKPIVSGLAALALSVGTVAMGYGKFQGAVEERLDNLEYRVSRNQETIDSVAVLSEKIDSLSRQIDRLREQLQRYEDAR